MRHDADGSPGAPRPSNEPQRRLGENPPSGWGGRAAHVENELHKSGPPFGNTASEEAQPDRAAHLHQRDG